MFLSFYTTDTDQHDQGDRSVRYDDIYYTISTGLKQPELKDHEPLTCTHV